ncbi:hypothetical protein TKK_0011090 [Trichogramma kaykai]
MTPNFYGTNPQKTAFSTFKNILCSQPILQFPDFSQSFVVTTDASNFALGAISSQGKIGSDLPFAYALRAFAKAELNYAAIEKELLGIVFAVQHFRPYLYRRRFTIVTDHKPFVWLHNLKNPTSGLACWKEKLRDYDYEIIHKPGRVKANADALSQNPIPILLPTPTSRCIDDYEHEIERRLFAINCLEHPNDRPGISNSRIGHRGLAVDGLEISHQGKSTKPGGYICHQGEAADGQDSHRAEPLHVDGQKGHLEEFPYLDGLVSHLAIPSDGPDYRERVIDNVEVSSEGSDTDDDMITGISLLPTGQPLERQLLDLNYLDLELIKTQQLNVGAITESGLSTGHSLFSLFIRNNHEETPDIDIICGILTNLGAALVELERKSISIAKSNEHLDDLYWLLIETHLEGLATQTQWA